MKKARFDPTIVDRDPAPRRQAKAAPRPHAPNPAHTAALADAESTGLLHGEKSEHVSFRAPPALIEAAKKATGIRSTTELGVLALAVLAQKDPFVAFLERTRGRLGKDHTLDY